MAFDCLKKIRKDYQDTQYAHRPEPELFPKQGRTPGGFPGLIIYWTWDKNRHKMMRKNRKVTKENGRLL